MIQDDYFRESKFSRLANLETGLFIVSLRTGTTVDHCVFIDALRNEIVECEEKKPIRLSGRSLRACGGVNIRWLYVVEVRELYCSRK